MTFHHCTFFTKYLYFELFALKNLKFELHKFLTVTLVYVESKYIYSKRAQRLKRSKFEFHLHYKFHMLSVNTANR